MMSETTVRRSFSRSLLFFLPTTLMISVASCDAPDPSGPGGQDILFKGKPSGDPEIIVEDFNPKEAGQGDTFTLIVDGQDFQDGSTVFIGRKGEAVSAITTIETRWKSSTRLEADIAISLEAEARDDYEVVVSFRRGKGIGTESFQVRRGKVSNYTITDLGTEGFVSDINDAGLIVGGFQGHAARWELDENGVYSMQLLDDGGWESGWAEAVNGSGAVVGVVVIDAAFTNRAALWRSGGGVELLPLLDPAHEVSQAYDINDAGQISGQSYADDWDTQRGVRWEPDGSVTALGFLPGYGRSNGWAINNLGWVGGTSGPDYDSGNLVRKQHAVLWIDDGSGQISAPVDLHPVPEIQSIVWGISDESMDGKVYIAGVVSLSPAAPVVWEVDVQTHAVIEHVLPGGGAYAVNAAGEVVVSGLKPGVWTLATGLLEPLLGLSSWKRGCNSRFRGINNDGTVVGSSGVKAKRQCVKHPVVWTKIN